jgi:organic hydroperoxide reductase OsmC/OhrA
MSTSYQYSVKATWNSERTSSMKAESVDLPILFSAPPEFHGQSGLWTPEHFLIAAVAGCFVTTFIAIAELSKFDFLSLEASAIGLLEKGEGGFQFTRALIGTFEDVTEARKKVAAFSEYWPGDYTIERPPIEQRADR